MPGERKLWSCDMMSIVVGSDADDGCGQVVVQLWVEVPPHIVSHCDASYISELKGFIIISMLLHSS